MVLVDASARFIASRLRWLYRARLLALPAGLGASSGAVTSGLRRQAASTVSMTSAVTTSKRVSEFGPKHIVIGTSPALAAARDDDATDPAPVVAPIEGVPTIAQEHLEPGAEVHRPGHHRHADAAEIAGRIAPECSCSGRARDR